MPLTDDELFRELLRIDDPVAQQLAILAKYRRLYDPVFKLEFQTPPKAINLLEFEQLLNQGDKLNWLLAYRKQKTFKVRLRGAALLDEPAGAPWEEPFGTPAKSRILGFAWPGHRFDWASVSSKIETFCKKSGWLYELRPLEPTESV